MLCGNARQAEIFLKRAVGVNPSSTQALGLLGQCYCLSDRPDECIALVEDVLKLNPYNPNAWGQTSVIALAHFAAERHDEAITAAREVLQNRPNSITGHMVLVAAFVEQKDIKSARYYYNELQQQRPDFSLQNYLNLIAPTARPDQLNRIQKSFRIFTHEV